MHFRFTWVAMAILFALASKTPNVASGAVTGDESKADVQLHRDDMQRFTEWHEAFGPPPTDAVKRLQAWVDSHPKDFESAVRLGQVLNSPEFGRTNPKAAYRLFEHAGASDLVEAKTALGQSLTFGVGVTPDPERGFKLIKSAADAGDARALAVLGTCYQRGIGPVQVDIPKARELLADAAQKGYGRALFLLAALESETSRDAKLVLRYLNEGAKAGDPQAWFGLARLYRDGEFAPKDLAESFRLMRTAADWGMGEALAEIAEYYYNGWGTPRDPAKARDCCIASAELACPAGEAIYADILLSGRYEGSFDAVNGMHWMRCAAEDGDGRSQYFMAIAYLTGASVPRDEAVGRQWLERSAKEDPAAAAFLRLLNAPKIEPRVGETNPSPPLKDEPTSRP